MASGHVDFREGKRGKSWYFTIPLPAGPDGKRRQRQKRGFRTKKEAQEACRKALEALRSTDPEPVQPPTVAEFLEQWLQHTRRNVSLSSYASYERTVRLHLVPDLGQIRLDQLTPLQIEQAHTAAAERGISPVQIRTNHSRLTTALRRAVRWRLLDRNPAEDVDPPRVPRREVGDERVRALSDAEAKRYLQHARGSFRLASLIALATGLRRGEVLGLRWQDLDLDAGKLRVRQTVEPPIKGSGLIIGPPKTESSRRDLRIPASLVAELRRARAEQAQKRLLGAEWHDHDLVLCTDQGQPIAPRTLNNWHHDTRRSAELPGLRFHDLRHTHATTLLRDGVDITTVSKRLGHSSVSMTLNVYSHVLPDMQELAAQRADAALCRLLAG